MKTTYFQNSTLSPYTPISAQVSSSKVDEVWKWGDDNLLPVALASLSRSSSIHRRILLDKADYITGRGFKCEDENLSLFTNSCNPLQESLRTVFGRVALDKCFFGNAILEIVLKNGTISVFHQDVSRARLAKDRKHMVLSADWTKYNAAEAKTLPLFPLFETQDDGTVRTLIHYKDYEPFFENYGVPKYIAALGAIAIAHKTEKWNISRIDNAFSLSGIMILDGTTSTEEEAERIALEAKARFEGNPGQVMFMVKDGSQGDSSKFVPITTSQEGDWKSLHEQSLDDIIVSHQWFRTLSGMEYASGFSSERVQNEYNIALSTIIKGEQQDLLEPLITIINDHTAMDPTTLEIVNLPPFDPRQPYMRIWEARKADGLSYDANDKSQQLYISQI